MKKLLFIFLIVLCFSCKEESSPAVDLSLSPGNWRLTFDLGNEKELPVQLMVNEDRTLMIRNADEEITVTEIIIEGDSIFIKPPVFEGYFKGKFQSKELITGQHVKPSLDRAVPFTMTAGVDYRFESLDNARTSSFLSGSYETVFSPDSKSDRYIAKGVFTQEGNQVTGTFETTTGDYRFLQGAVVNDTLKLSTFDGAHAFLFEAVVRDSTLEGMFYSGNHWKEPFTAVLNNDYNLPDATTLTYLKEGYDSVDFSFKDVDGKQVSLQDAEFKDQVVVVQLLGSWCPNCLEETRFFQEYINSQKSDVKFIGLAFEYAPTEKAAMRSIKRLIEAENVTYPILLAQYGSTNKKTANEKLPMLNHVLSYPTSIYIDKSGKVRRIHTGYNGLATGQKHARFKEEFYHFLKELQTEPLQ
ncbi:TlpA disulfide reductase family protein [uncultured Nonlabens sp.]|uniref:TlpA disulfide reductase family protein n=1 Tax=uncultured Nonlabens sp. TaxID=859306 RepID=UPI002628F04D|nr:TlpA disulfide reductase family protein [uncultured Nonlabens sp.]